MEKVVLDKAAIDRARGMFVERTSEVEVPELNDLMGAEDGSVVVVKICQLDLNTYLEAQQQQHDMYRNLVEGVVEAALQKGMVSDHIAQQLGKMTPSTRHRIRILKEGIVDPKLKDSDLHFICKIFPTVAMRIYNAIIDLTNRGGVKKNSRA